MKVDWFEFKGLRIRYAIRLGNYLMMAASGKYVLRSQPPGNFCQRQINRWSKQYRAAETETIKAMEYLLRWLPQNIPADDGEVKLIHGDYRLDNLIFHPTEPRVLAVLDWNFYKAETDYD